MVNSLLILAAFTFSGFSPENTAVSDKKNPKIQVSLLLDTSNSMDGLIDQAKSQLWKMVNELASASKAGQAPDIEIALYQYGNDGLSVSKGYVEQVLPLTNDLDEVSARLFSLKTNGGSEYCGWAIRDAAKDLTWSSDKDDLRLIIIAGNEPFDQGPVTPMDATKAASDKDICITTIFCGDWNEGSYTGWKISQNHDCTNYLNIDQDEQVRHIPTPYDDTIVALNTALNATYVAYGTLGAEKIHVQQLQDVNAAEYSTANLRERASFKAKSQYTNTSWDLVDATENNEDFLEKLDKDELPAEMKKMNEQEQKQYIEAKRAERERIQADILTFEEKARNYAAENADTEKEKSTLDEVVKQSVRKLAEENGFKF